MASSLIISTLDPLQAVDIEGGALLLLLDLIASFDTIDHQTLRSTTQINFLEYNVLPSKGLSHISQTHHKLPKLVCNYTCDIMFIIYVVIDIIIFTSTIIDIFIIMFIIMVKVQFRRPEFLRKRGHYFKKNCAYLVSLCLREQVGGTINGWPLFDCNFNVFADMILPYGSHYIDMTPSPEPINGATGMWLSCFANVWLAESSRAPALWRHDHNDDDQNMVVLPIVGGRLAMLMEDNLPLNYSVNEMKSM